MGMIEAGLPSIPAAGLAMGANQGAAVLQAAGVAGVVPGAAINTAAAGFLFGMLMTQLAAGISQPATGKETDAKAPKDSDTPQQPSPDATSVLASLVPLLVSLSVQPQPSNPAAAQTSDAVSSGGTTLPSLALATLTAATSTTPGVPSVLLTLDSAPAEPQPSNTPTAHTPDAVSNGGATLPSLALPTLTAVAATIPIGPPALISYDE